MQSYEEWFSELRDILFEEYGIVIDDTEDIENIVPKINFEGLSERNYRFGVSASDFFIDTLEEYLEL